MAYSRDVDSALKALAEPRRREILRLVWSRELPAADIASHFTEVTRSAISQHLAVLREAQLVTERRDGTRRLYQADHDEMARLRHFLDRYWTDGLSRLRDAAEAAEREAGRDRDPHDSDRRDKEH
jgi:DNA-binding transcriptional ArsR family regulator